MLNIANLMFIDDDIVYFNDYKRPIWVVVYNTTINSVIN